jgi:hypothetical protein
MPVTRMLRLSFVVVLAIACSSDATSPPLRDFVNAVARAQCGAADGPAVEIFLMPNPVAPVVPTAPFVRVYVEVELNALTGRTWPVGAGAVAWFQPDASTYELAEAGYLVVTSVDSENTITGTVDLDFPDAGHIRREFRATWIPTHALCA